MIGDLIGGRLVVGIEDDPDEPAVRVYLDARYKNRYVLVNAEQGERLRRDWASCRHMFVDVPADAEVFLDR